MTSFISKNNLFLKCDGCERVVKIYENQTDHTLIHDYIRENNWKTHKIKGKWKHFCPECEEFYLQKKREENFKELKQDD
jgi:hypothetical protein